MKQIYFYTVKRESNQFITDLLYFFQVEGIQTFVKTSITKNGDGVLFTDLDLRKRKLFTRCFCRAFKRNKDKLISAYIYDFDSNQLLFKTTSASFPQCLDYYKEGKDYYSKTFNAREIINDTARAL